MVDSQRRWTDKQKSALVERVIRGQLTLQDACRQYSLSMDQVKEWVRIFRREARQALDDQVRSALSDQGMEVDDLAAAEFSGNVDEMSVAELIQTIQMGRKDAVITIEHDGEHSNIWCSSGEVIDAEAGPLTGELAVYRLLALSRGTVNADFSPVHRVRNVQMSTQGLLMDAARRSDEAEQIRARLGDTGAVYGPSALALAPDAEMTREQVAVLRLFNGSRTLEDVVIDSDLGDLETLTVIDALLQREFLQFRSVPGPLSIQMQPPPSSEEGDLPFLSLAASQRMPLSQKRKPVMWGAVSALGLALVAGAFFLVSGGSSPGEESSPSDSKGAAALPATLPTPRPCPEGMALITGGKFFMGSDSSHPVMKLAQPAHQVTLDTYCIDKLEVTIGEFAECAQVGECERPHRKAEFPRGGLDEESWQKSQRLHSEQCNEGKSGRDDHPANCVSYHQARQYCAFREARLPTEAEWEFAARGTDGRVFPWGDENPDATRVNACGSECAAWHREVGLDAELHGVMYDEDDKYTGTAPVGSFPAGATIDGVKDLIGNVFEWTSGGIYPYAREAVVNPQGPADSEKFVIRGGAFNSGIAVFSDPALRFGMAADTYSHGVGFRCASDPVGLKEPEAAGDGLPSSEGSGKQP